MWSAS